MKKILQEFMDKEAIRLIEAGKIDNEYGLQFELGYYLRKKDYDVSFEKNIKNINTCKHEIDLLCNKDNSKYAIELKFPLGVNKGYTDQLYKFIQDVQFCEELKDTKAYKKTYCITLVDDKAYYKLTNKEKNCVWRYFRGDPKNNEVIASERLYGNVTKQVKGINKQNYKLKECYQIKWKYLDIVNNKQYWYYILEI